MRTHYVLGLIALASHYFGATPLRAQDFHVEALKTEYQRNPIGIDVRQPRLSWRIHAVRRGTMQSAYELRVATDSASLQREPIWTSSKVSSAASILRPYGGPALRSGTRYHWQVRVWDDAGRASPWSAPAFWETGLLDRADWTARWITPDLNEDTTRANPSPMLRREFTLGARHPLGATVRHEPRSLRGGAQWPAASATGLFRPGWTSYDKRLQYDTYDVTSLLRAGPNAIGATLGDGWYRGRLGFEGKRNTYGKRLAPARAARRSLRRRAHQVIGDRRAVEGVDRADPHVGHLRRRELRRAAREAGLESPRLRRPRLARRQAGRRLRAAARSRRSARRCDASQEIKPARVLRTPTGQTVFDIGQNMVGWVRLKVRGPAGTTVRLRHAEVLDKAGNFYTANLRDAAQTVQYTLKGGGAEVFEPHFTFQGFRYVAVEGYPGTPTPDAITGVVVHSDIGADRHVRDVQRAGEPASPEHRVGTDAATSSMSPPTVRSATSGSAGRATRRCSRAPPRSTWTSPDSSRNGWRRRGGSEAERRGAVGHPRRAVGRGTTGGDASAGWADAAVIVPWTMYSVVRRHAAARAAVPEHARVGRVHAQAGGRAAALDQRLPLRRLARLRRPFAPTTRARRPTRTSSRRRTSRTRPICSRGPRTC